MAAGAAHCAVAIYAHWGLAALEVAFHEAAHFLAAPGKPFIVGEAVRRSLQRAGQPYTPFVYAQKLFSDRYRDVESVATVTN